MGSLLFGPGLKKRVPFVFSRAVEHSVCSCGVSNRSEAHWVYFPSRWYMKPPGVRRARASYRRAQQRRRQTAVTLRNSNGVEGQTAVIRGRGKQTTFLRAVSRSEAAVAAGRAAARKSRFGRAKVPGIMRHMGE